MSYLMVLMFQPHLLQTHFSGFFEEDVITKLFPFLVFFVMPLPWKKSKSGRISRFVSDLQQSPKHGGSLFVETGFPTSLIDLFVKNRDRLKKSSSKAQTPAAHPARPRVLSPPLRQKFDPASVTEDLAASKIDACGLTSEYRHDGDNNNKDDGRNGGDRGGGCCVLTVVAVKVFVVAVLALSTKKLALGITISAFTLLFLELVVARVFTLLSLCPDAQVKLHSLVGKLIGKKKREEKVEELSSSSMQERKNNKVSFEIIESFQESRDCIEEVSETIREVVLIKEKSKSAKLKYKIVKKIVPKKLRSYKKKKLEMKEKEEAEGVEIELVQDDDDESLTEVSSLYSQDRIESEISEKNETASNPPLLESCEEIEEEGKESGSKGDLSKVIVLLVIALTGLLSGKVLAIVLTLSSCLILRFAADKSQTSL